jgi:hypothetical protein
MYIGSKSLAIVVGYLSKEWITFVDSKFVGLFVKLKNKIENKNKLLMSRHTKCLSKCWRMSKNKSGKSKKVKLRVERRRVILVICIVNLKVGRRKLIRIQILHAGLYWLKNWRILLQLIMMSRMERLALMIKLSWKETGYW